MELTKEFWFEQLGESWAMRLKPILKDPYMKKLMDFIEVEYALNDCIPSKKDIFKCFKLCDWKNLKVVIIGQEPHHSYGGANGLAFADKNSTLYHNNTLCAIYDCIAEKYDPNGFYFDFDFTLENWAKQGVLLLNTTLTTRASSLGSHKKPWGKFVSAVLNEINEFNHGTIFILWGDEAQKLIPYISKRNYILKFHHPNEFFNKLKKWDCPNFKEADKILIDLYGETIDW